MTARLAVLVCGAMTSLQDGGRFGSMRFGMSRSGAMDRLALAHANALVGNPPGTGAVELMLAGGSFRIEDGPVRIGLAGATAAATLDGSLLAPGRSAVAQPGQILAVSAAKAGIFTYLAVAGGFAVPAALGSVSLQPRAGIGGVDGRALRAGDELPLAEDGPPSGPDLALPPPGLAPDDPIRVVFGPQADHFDEGARALFLDSVFRVSSEADRMGYRLDGPTIPHLRGFNIVSDGIVAGSIQVPGSGVPIVMMADHQTTGGYPKIATIVSADLRILAQRGPGAPVRFGSVTIEEAQRLARERAATIAALRDLARPVRGLPSVEDLLALNLAGDAQDALAPEHAWA